MLKILSWFILKTIIEWSVVIGVIYYFFSAQLEFLTNQHIIILFVSLISFLIWKTHKHYIWLISQSSTTLKIIEIKSSDKELKEIMILMHENYLLFEKYTEESRVKLELLRSFSPVPIVIFILTLLKDQEDNLVLSFFNNTFQISSLYNHNNLFTLLILGIIFLYAVNIFSTWESYKSLNARKFSYLIEFEKVKLKDN